MRTSGFSLSSCQITAAATRSRILRAVERSRAALPCRAALRFSRRILAWKVSSRLEPGNSIEILLQAGSGLEGTPTGFADSGIENVNAKIDGLIESGTLKRLLASTEISFSNSLVEAWWRSLKHQWLYLNSLDSVSSLKRLVSFYVTEHNTRLPHSAFDGQTPDERYFGMGETVSQELEAARASARKARLKANRSLSCSVCEDRDPR